MEDRQPLSTAPSPNSSSKHHEVKVIAAVPAYLRESVYARLALEGKTFKQWLSEHMESYVAQTPLQDNVTPINRPPVADVTSVGGQN